MPDAPATLQIDLQNVVQRLSAQIGQLSAELAAAQEAIEVQQKKITGLATELAVYVTPPKDAASPPDDAQ